MQTVDSTKDEVAAQLRFESFKLGKPLPPSKSMPLKHRHARSHSRNASVSSSISSLSLSLAKPTNPHDSLTTTNSMPSLSSKRNSHHRRRSSVSTRHESAEIMGVSLPDIPASSSEENVNFGEKDSIRRRALWALEGKPDVSYSKVEIPELSSPEMERKLFEFSSKPSFPSSSAAGYGAGLNNVMGSKRDSFKLLGPSSSSKDQLHTLVEEEEEEEWDGEKSLQEISAIPQSTSPVASEAPITPNTPELLFSKGTPSRPRPATLSLRPLSLGSSIVATNHGLPTPSLTPRSGLKSLSLVPNDELPTTTNNVIKRQSLTLGNNNVPSPNPTNSRARPALNLQISSEGPGATAINAVDDSEKPQVPARRSSICYKTSSSSTNLAGLPTPEMTPTFAERRYSGASHNSFGSNASAGVGSSVNGGTDEDFFPSGNTSYSRHRPLSASEQHFLFKSHNALLSRIQDLERALIVRRESVSSYGGSRPMSSLSVADSEDTSLSEPSDEMLRLVADLKAERDELKRDVDGWRVRVGDLEKQIGLLAKRVEGERREAWVARSRVGLLEIEKGDLEKELEQVKGEVKRVEEEKDNEVARFKELVRGFEERQRRSDEENERLKMECEKLKTEAELHRTTDVAEDDVLATPTPRFSAAHAHSTWRRGLQFASLDSQASSTDVEFGSMDAGHSQFGFSLKAVEEENEDEDGPQMPEEDVDDEDYMSEDEDNGLAGYEDEEDSDLSFQSPGSSSSFGSEDEMYEPRAPRSVVHLQSEAPMPLFVSVSPPVSSLVSSGTNTPSTLTPGSRSASNSPPPVENSQEHMGAFKFPRAAEPVPAPAPALTHKPANSLSSWSFPRAVQLKTSDAASSRDEIDHFFGCFEDSETDSTGSRSPVSPSVYTYEHSKGLFAKGLQAYSDDDEVMPFSLPPSVIGTIVDESHDLEVVIEEDECDEDDEETRVDEDEDEDMFGEIGGIKITFTPPMDDDEYRPEVDDEKQQEQDTVTETPTLAQEEEEQISTPQRVLSVRTFVTTFEDEDEDEDTHVPFSFGRKWPMSTPPTAAVMMTPPPTAGRIVSLPSSIPRMTRSASPSSPSGSASASRLPVAVSTRSPPSDQSASAFVTPPTKRGGAIPSFIPQPVSASSPTLGRSGPIVRAKPTTTFMRQPSRRPLMATGNGANKDQISATASSSANDSNGSAFIKSQLPHPVNFDLPTRAHSLNRSVETDVFASNSSFTNVSEKSQSYTGVQQTAEGDGMKSVDLGSSNVTSPIAPSSPLSPSSNYSFSNYAYASPVSPSLSSFMTSPKLSLQTLSSFIPRPWAAFGGAADVVSTQSSPVLTSPQTPVKPGLVSKEKQVERLRQRFQREGLMISHADACKKCDGQAIVL